MDIVKCYGDVVPFTSCWGKNALNSFILPLTNSKCKFNKCNLFYFARIYRLIWLCRSLEWLYVRCIWDVYSIRKLVHVYACFMCVCNNLDLVRREAALCLWSTSYHQILLGEYLYWFICYFYKLIIQLRLAKKIKKNFDLVFSMLKPEEHALSILFPSSTDLYCILRGH